MITILIVHGTEWFDVFRRIIRSELPYLAGNVLYTNSFDEAVDLTQVNHGLIVISSDRFYDRLSSYREFHKAVMPDRDKNGAKLAEMIKAKNPKCKFFIFSKYPISEESKFIDGFIPEHQPGDMLTQDVMMILSRSIDSLRE